MLGSSLLVVGALFLGVSVIVSSALSLGSGACAGTACAPASPAAWFAWASVPFLVIGALLLVLGLWRGLR